MTAYRRRVKLEPDTEPRSESTWQPELGGHRHGVQQIQNQVTQLFEDFRGPVYHYVLVTLDNPSKAEEITQDVFFKLYRCLRSGNNIANVKGWIFRVAHNLALNEKASTKRVLTLELGPWDTVCRFHQDPAPNPEQWVLQQEKSHAFESAFARLPVQQRQCMMLRAQGFRYVETAKILGISIASVAQSLRRGIRKLREA